MTDSREVDYWLRKAADTIATNIVESKEDYEGRRQRTVLARRISDSLKPYIGRLIDTEIEKVVFEKIKEVLLEESGLTQEEMDALLVDDE